MTGRATTHGRVNLIGEHTDYSDGFVLPALIPQSLTVTADPLDDAITVTSEGFAPVSRSLGQGPQGDWADYAVGAATLTLAELGQPDGVALTITSDIPGGGGVSSSAALCVAVIRAVLNLHDMDWPADRIARLAQRVEHEWAGLQCGIMDQMVIAAAKPGEALFLDCRDLSFQTVPLFPDHVFAVIHSGQDRRLAEGAYNDRAAAVAEASSQLGVSALRDADDWRDLTDPLLIKRARHVITENRRVEQAVKASRSGDAPDFGQLMNESHQSLANDFEVSTDILDQLCDSARRHGALGARLTGAGFGGCIVALVDRNQVSDWWAKVSADCPDSWAVTLG